MRMNRARYKPRLVKRRRRRRRTVWSEVKKLKQHEICTRVTNVVLKFNTRELCGGYLYFTAQRRQSRYYNMGWKVYGYPIFSDKVMYGTKSITTRADYICMEKKYCSFFAFFMSHRWIITIK